MITTYHRPDTIEKAIELLKQPDTMPLGGGTWINSPACKSQDVVVVDLQALGLTHIRKHGNNLEIDACVTLQQLHENPHCPEALKQAIRLDMPINLRNMATVAGALVTCDGRSTFAAMMLAMDGKITITGDKESVITLGEFLPLRTSGLITQITLPINTSTAFEQVARTPADKPIVCAALAQWSSGRTRLALGGYGQGPLLAMDGTEADGIVSAARSAFHEAVDAIASAEYRMDVAATLAKRCLESTRN